MIKIYDQFLNDKNYAKLVDYAKYAPYQFKEKDHLDAEFVGGIYDISLKDDLFLFLDREVKSRFEEVKNIKCQRAYINLFISGEKPYFHIDANNGYTFLMYLNEEYNIDMGGETSFLINGELRGILPVPNRAIIFDSSIEHKANSFRKGLRYTLALKYNNGS